MAHRLDCIAAFREVRKSPGIAVPCTEAADLLRALGAENARLREDSARLDWLSANPRKVTIAVTASGKKADMWYARNPGSIMDGELFETLREAIDHASAARATPPASGG